ncbi:MAG: hypothetical protein EKK53_09760 [Burkholderiales bacterium]|nr:MAG: hypothetical protein EKK53_09760 [Burkholderiales bacterium]
MKRPFIPAELEKRFKDGLATGEKLNLSEVNLEIRAAQQRRNHGGDSGVGRPALLGRASLGQDAEWVAGLGDVAEQLQQQADAFTRLALEDGAFEFVEGVVDLKWRGSGHVAK